MKLFNSLAITLSLYSLPAAQAFEVPGFITEDQFAQDFDLRVVPFIQSGETSSFVGKDGVSLFYRRILQANAKANVVLVHGFNESELKFRELAYIFGQSGYNVHLYDHRGFGQSEKSIEGKPTQAWVQNFDDYVADMNIFFQQVYDAKGLPTFVLAHSMGAVVVARYMQQYDNVIQKAVLSSPMIQPDSSPYPAPLAMAIAKAAIIAGQGKNFALGQDPFPNGQPAEGKPDSSSSVRVDRLLADRESTGYPAVGATWRWVYESLKQTGSTLDRRNTAKIKAPILLFQATEDKYVNLEPQRTFCQRVPQCQLEVVQGAEHAIFYERDIFLGPYLEKVLAFLK